MQVEYFVWEMDGVAASWAVEEGESQTLGDFLSEQARNQETHAGFRAKMDAEISLASWSEDRTRPLPPGWRCARPDEIARIKEILSQRLHARAL